MRLISIFPSDYLTGDSSGSATQGTIFNTGPWPLDFPRSLHIHQTSGHGGGPLTGRTNQITMLPGCYFDSIFLPSIGGTGHPGNDPNAPKTWILRELEKESPHTLHRYCSPGGMHQHSNSSGLPFTGMTNQYPGHGGAGESPQNCSSGVTFPIIGPDDFTFGNHSLGKIAVPAPSVASLTEPKSGYQQHQYPDQGPLESTQVTALVEGGGPGEWLLLPGAPVPSPHHRHQLFQMGHPFANPRDPGSMVGTCGMTSTGWNCVPLTWHSDTLKHQLLGHHVLMRTDNVTAKPHMNRQEALAPGS